MMAQDSEAVDAIKTLSPGAQLVLQDMRLVILKRYTYGVEADDESVTGDVIAACAALLGLLTGMATTEDVTNAHGYAMRVYEGMRDAVIEGRK